MRRATLVLLLLASAAAADEDPLAREVEDYLDSDLDTIVVTATRSEAVAFDTPYAAESVAGETIRRRAYRTTPQVLSSLPGVMVQETSPGQGSPYIRGFTGYQNLLMIDGVRLNNSVFRSGPNEYWNLIDPLSVRSLEVVKGPASVLYGSDAIGGTVNAITSGPDWTKGYGGRVWYRGSTAESSHMVRGEGSAVRGEATGVLAGLSYKELGDLIAGDPMGRQENTGYDDWAGDVKVEHFLDPDTRLVALYQSVRQNDVPRTHSTVFGEPFHGTTVGTDLRRDNDLERELLYLQLHKERMEGFADTLRASVSWQRLDEVRDRLRTGDRRDLQGFDVNTVGLWAQLESETAAGRLTYGIDFYHDDVDSFSTANAVQGPVADDARYELLGLFVQDAIDASDRLEVTLGARFTWAEAAADRFYDPTTMAASSFAEDWTSLVGSVRATWQWVPQKWNVFGGVSQGFRAPNLSDLTRLDNARTNEFEVPATGLDPEDYLQLEIGVKGRPGRHQLQVTTFYTIIDDEIVRVPTGDVDADGNAIVTKDNVGDGWLFGVELSGAYRIRERWTLFGNLTWLDGRTDTFPTSAPVIESEYRDRVMPLTAQIGLRWEDPERRLWFEALSILAGKADRLSTRDEQDTQRIPPGGTPGYGVLHLRSGWRPVERVTLQAAVENVFDKSYRVHGSGSNMPGVNFIFSLNVDF